MQRKLISVINCSVWKLQMHNYAVAYDIIRLSALMSLDSLFRLKLSHFLAYNCFLWDFRGAQSSNIKKCLWISRLTKSKKFAGSQSPALVSNSSCYYLFMPREGAASYSQTSKQLHIHYFKLKLHFLITNILLLYKAIRNACIFVTIYLNYILMAYQINSSQENMSTKHINSVRHLSTVAQVFQFWLSDFLIT